MSILRVASRYAKSLLDLSIEQNKVEVVKSDLESFLKVLAMNHNKRVLLRNPIVKAQIKINIVNKIFGASFDQLTLAFMAIVLKKGRGPYLKEIAESYIQQYNEMNNIITATVKSAVDLNESTSKEIQDFVAKSFNKKVILSQIKDQSLIGGFTLQIGDRMFDGSISGKLQKAKKELLNSYISK
jgi:F-type H+-transporting ATPase subunit delta